MAKIRKIPVEECETELGMMPRPGSQDLDFLSEEFKETTVVILLEDSDSGRKLGLPVAEKGC